MYRGLFCVDEIEIFSWRQRAFWKIHIHVELIGGGRNYVTSSDTPLRESHVIID